MIDFMEIFDQDYAPKLAGRAPTFRAVVREALSRNVTSIVETGCTRKENNWDGDGQSTLIWTNYVKCRGVGKFSTVDISDTATNLAMQLCPTAEVFCMDSIKFLQSREYHIDLLYLDSYDLDAGAPHDAALHCFMELCAAMPRLHKNSIVFVDDSPAKAPGGITGKGMYVYQYFKQLGVNPFTFGYQAAWLVP